MTIDGQMGKRENPAIYTIGLIHLSSHPLTQPIHPPIYQSSQPHADILDGILSRLNQQGMRERTRKEPSPLLLQQLLRPLFMAHLLLPMRNQQF